MWIVVEKGNIFEGNEKQWADCFFTNVTEENVRNFCAEEGWKVEIRSSHESRARNPLLSSRKRDKEKL